MGALDFITKPLSVVSNAVETACDKLLPKELEFIGDIASGATNYLTGNYAGLLSDAVDLLDNVKNGDVFRFASKYLGVDLHLGNAEPGPPPGPVAGPGWSSVRSEKTTATEETTAALREAKASDASNRASTAAASGASTTERAKGKTETAGKQAALDFMNAYKNPEDLMRAIKNGHVPPEIAESQTGMMMLQQKLQDLQRMFQLMTQMLQAMHEMSMSIVRNVRA